jgi:hypothetical protein
MRNCTMGPAGSLPPPDLRLYFGVIYTKPNSRMPNADAPTSPKARAHSRRKFYHNLLKAFGLAASIIAFSLGLGILGYHCIAGLDWVDSLLNASMILGGMGPVDALKTDGAKVFASAYALFSGVVFIMATGVLLSPIFHHVLYKFHIEERDSH